jgi:hypothetical protein
VVQIAQALRDDRGRLLDATTVSGLAASLAVMYLTGLLITA